MTVYTEQVAEVEGKGLPSQTHNLYDGTVKIRNISDKPIEVGGRIIEGEKEVLVNSRDPKTKRDLVHYIGEYIVTGNNVQSQLEILVGGPTALVSPTGPIGPTGPTGMTGSAGIAGSAATISVGTVSTTGPTDPAYASVVNSGTSSAAVLNFKIPVGPTGPTGAAGITLSINAQASTYTLVLSDQDKLVEMSGGGTLAIPGTNIAFPVGAQINVLQTGASQVTIAATGPTAPTINATPGLKLRTQWSSATLIKRASNTWVAIGDLIA
jgi:hypothetical protein